MLDMCIYVLYGNRRVDIRRIYSSLYKKKGLGGEGHLGSRKYALCDRLCAAVN